MIGIILACTLVAWLVIVLSDVRDERAPERREWIGPGACLPLALAQIDDKRRRSKRRWS